MLSHIPEDVFTFQAINRDLHRLEQKYQNKNDVVMARDIATLLVHMESLVNLLSKFECEVDEQLNIVGEHLYDSIGILEPIEASNLGKRARRRPAHVTGLTAS